MFSYDIIAKKIVFSHLNDGWFGSNYNMNIYHGCSHGCIYCDSRSDCYKINNFDIVRKKKNALTIIEQDLKSKRKKGIVMTGSMSDPYNPIEDKYLLTRGALELIDKYRFGVIINTKSHLVCRDLDVLEKISKHSPVAVNISITTADEKLCKKIEPRASSTNTRMQTVKTLSNKNIMCGIILMPILPFINDTVDNISELVELSAASNARWIYPGNYFGVTLREGQKNYFFNQIENIFPNLKQRYVDLYKNQKDCVSPNNNILKKYFEEKCEKHGLLSNMDDIVKYIKKNGTLQLSIFD